VNFDFDKATIKPDSAAILDEGVRKLEEVGDANVKIVGHTDSIGSDAYNQTLSERRAEAVREYFVAHGIAASRLTTEGRGESEPVASNDTKDGRYMNRRVELYTNGRSGGMAAAAPSGACDPKHWQCIWHEVQMK
jgi:OOP family OmpA-OmpF porin